MPYEGPVDSDDSKGDPAQEGLPPSEETVTSAEVVQVAIEAAARDCITCPHYPTRRIDGSDGPDGYNF